MTDSLKEKITWIIDEQYQDIATDRISDEIILEFEKRIDDEISKNLREYVVGDLRPQLIESYYEGYREALKKLKKEILCK